MFSEAKNLFHNLSGLEDDKCYMTEREKQNQRFDNWQTTNHYAADCGLERQIQLATAHPAMMIKGGYGNCGAGGCNVDHDSRLRVGSLQTNLKSRISLYHRPFATVPYLGRGQVRPVMESYLQHGDFVRNKKSCSTTTEMSHIPYRHTPMVQDLAQSIQDPRNLVEEVADDGWVRGGLPSRELIRDQDYRRKY